MPQPPFPPAELDASLEYLEKTLIATKKHPASLDANGNARLKTEYGTINEGAGSHCHASEAPENATHNRYKNIMAYDTTRVIVEPDGVRWGILPAGCASTFSVHVACM